MSTIRLAVRENVLSNPNKVTPQMYEDYLVLLGRGWVAEVDGTIIGFSYADAPNASIWALFIAPGYEGKGLAKQLLNLATGWLFEQGKTCVRLSTGAGTRAEQFYRLQGWTRDHTDGNEVFYLLMAAHINA